MTILEQFTMRKLAAIGEFKSFYHDGFWQSMDTKSEKDKLERLWTFDKAPGKCGKTMEFDLSFYKGKKVFVIGHTGFKGSWLCKLLKYVGDDVTGYSLRPPTAPSIFEIAGVANDIHSVIGDIRDYIVLKVTFDEVHLKLYCIWLHKQLFVIVIRSLYIHRTNMQAAVGCEQLKKLSSFIERRRHNWNRLHRALECVQDKIILPVPAENSCLLGSVS